MLFWLKLKPIQQVFSRMILNETSMNTRVADVRIISLFRHSIMSIQRSIHKTLLHIYKYSTSGQIQRQMNTFLIWSTWPWQWSPFYIAHRLKEMVSMTFQVIATLVTPQGAHSENQYTWAQGGNPRQNISTYFNFESKDVTQNLSVRLKFYVRVKQSMVRELLCYWMINILKHYTAWEADLSSSYWDFCV